MLESRFESNVLIPFVRNNRLSLLDVLKRNILRRNLKEIKKSIKRERRGEERQTVKERRKREWNKKEKIIKLKRKKTEKVKTDR